MARDSNLQIRLFGGFHVACDSKPVPGLHSMRLQSLLAYLVLNRGSPQSRQHLSFCFWPDSSEAQARTNLRQLLHHLRQAIPDSDRFFLVDKQFLQWKPDSPFTLDVAEFEQAIGRAKQSAEQRDSAAMAGSFEKAAEFYRGDLFPGCYEEWIEPVRTALKKEYTTALQKLIEYFENNRRYQKAIIYGERLLDCDNLHEKSWSVLMRLHALNGDRSKALRLYKECEEVLRRELGIEPAPELQKTAERLAAGEMPGEDGSDKEPKTGKQLSPDWDLVGRKHEWETLLNNWKQVLGGACRFVCISGEPGIGKSRLGLELLHNVRRQGYTAAYSRSYETAGILSYGPVTDWLREEGFYKRWAGLDPVWLKELARLLPELLVTFPELPHPGPLSEKWQRRHFFEALAKAFLSEEKPKLLFLDDLQWCDRETLEWLAYLFHIEETAKLLIIGTLRPMEGASNEPLQNLLAELHSAGSMTEINLDGLDESESLELAAQVAGSDMNPYPHIYRESEGNPLFVVEMIRQGYFRSGESGFQKRKSSADLDSGQYGESMLLPPKVNAIISARFERLTERTRELMWLAAAIGREFRFDILVHASGLEESVIIRSLEELLHHHMIKELRSGAYDFSHDKLREVAVRTITNTRKRYLHKQIAGAIEAIHGNNLKAVSSRLAFHYDRAGMVEKAIACYQTASEHAREIYANEESEMLLKRAVELLNQLPEGEERNRLERDLQTGLVLTLIQIKGYGADEVLEACSRIFSLSETLHELPPFPLKRIYAIGILVHGCIEESVQIGRELYDQAGSTGDNIERVEACYVLGVTLSRQAKYPKAKKFFEEGLDRYNPGDQQDHILRFGQDPSVICMIRLAQVEWLSGDHEKAQHLGNVALKQSVKINHPFTMDYVKTHFAWLCNLKNDSNATLKLSEEVLTTSYNHGFINWLSICEILCGYSQFRLGFKEKGITRMREGLRLYDIAGIWVDRPYFRSLFAEALSEQGDEEWEKAIAISDRAVKECEETEYLWLLPEIYRIRGHIYLKKSPPDVDNAQKSFKKAVSIARNHKASNFEQRALESLEKIVP
jgi:DNA-binding SARP family transcriptional activator